MPKYFVPLVATPPMDNGGGGGSDLPAVSAADNGDVLTVVNGAWDKAAPGGGGGSSAYVVNIIEDEETGYFTCDKTAAEIYEAAQTTPVIFVNSFGEFGSAFNVVSSIYAPNGYTFVCVLHTPEWQAWVFSAATGSDYPTDGGGSQ